MHIIVGLGNPGPEYENTRHNMGFKVITSLSSMFSPVEFKHKKKCFSLVGEALFEGRKIIFAQPQTYMNLSGQAVSALLHWHKVSPNNLIVIYDDVDLEVGQIRIRSGGGSSGHRGVESVISETGTSDFIRIRIGIGRDDLKDVKDYVLEPISFEQQQVLTPAVDSAAKAAISIILNGVDFAMNQFNK